MMKVKEKEQYEVHYIAITIPSLGSSAMVKTQLNSSRSFCLSRSRREHLRQTNLPFWRKHSSQPSPVVDQPKRTWRSTCKTTSITNKRASSTEISTSCSTWHIKLTCTQFWLLQRQLLTRLPSQTLSTKWWNRRLIYDEIQNEYIALHLRIIYQYVTEGGTCRA